MRPSLALVLRPLNSIEIQELKTLKIKVFRAPWIPPITELILHEEFNPTIDILTKVNSELRSEPYSCINSGTQNVHLPSFFMVQGISLWYYIRFLVLTKLRNRLMEWYLVQEFLDLGHDPDTVAIYTRFEHEKLKCVLPKTIARPKLFRPIFNVLTFLVAFGIRTLVGMYLLTSQSIRRKHIICIPADLVQPVLSVKKKTLVAGDPIAQSLLESIPKEFLIASEFFPPKFSGPAIHWSSLELFPRFKRQIFLEPLILASLFRRSVIQTLLRSNRLLRKKLGFLIRLELDKRINPLYGHVLALSKGMYLNNSRLILLQSVFKYLKPRSITTHGEHDSQGRGYIDTASLIAAPSFGIQHGVIDISNLNYQYGKQDLGFVHIPQHTFLWGSYWRQNLQNSCIYNDQNTLIAGQLRTDIVPYLLQQKKKAGIITLLYISQPLHLHAGKSWLRDALTHDIFQLAKELGNMRLWIKPHPRETDENYFHQIARKIKTGNYQIYRGPLYPKLAQADLILVYNSTVGAEATFFNKPLIILNYDNNDLAGYIKSGIGFSATNYSELKAAIQLFLTDDINWKPLLKRQLEYKEQIAWSIDGKRWMFYLDQIQQRSKEWKAPL